MAKNDNLRNYTVEDVLNRYPDRTLYIGASAGYLWIGKGSEARFALKCLTKKYKALKKHTLEKNQATLLRWEKLRPILVEQLERFEKSNKKKKTRDKQAEIDKLDNSIAGIKETIIKNKNTIKNFKPMLERRIRDIYVRPIWQEEDVLGIAVLMEGDEIGSYWNMKDFNRKPKEWLCK